MSQHHHFIVDDQIYTSPNSSRFPNLPPPRPLVEDTPTSKDWQIPRWAETRHPFLAYVPLSPRFDKNPFSRLRPVGKKFPVVGSGTTWRVAPSTVSQFKSLEDNLVFIAQTLQCGSLIHLDFKLVSLPSNYGYSRMHKSKYGAEKSVELSRDAFLPLMAWCSCLISARNVLVEVPDNVARVLVWEHRLQEAGVNFDAIKEIKDSELADFSAGYPRVGVFVSHDQWTFHNQVKQFVRDNVPVWIHWGKIKSAPIGYGPLEKYLPNNARLAAVQAKNAAEAQVKAEDEAWRAAVEAASYTRDATGSEPQSSGQAVAQMTSPAPAPSVPPPVRNSGQRHGETWREYLARMEEKREERLAVGTYAARQVMLSREEAQRTHQLPGRGSSAPVVWHWDEDDDTGFRIRTRVDRAQVPDIWEQYTNSQRRFNSLLNEWDICTELDPEAEPEDIDDGYGAFDDMRVDTPTRAPTPLPGPTPPRAPTPLPIIASPAPAPPHALTPPPCPASPRGPTSPPPSHQTTAPPATTLEKNLRWHNEHAETYDQPSTMSVLFFRDMLAEEIYYRYGFVDSGGNDTYTSHLDWDRVRIAFGRPDFSVELRLRGPISHFLQCMISPNRNTDMPAELWDLSVNCRDQLSYEANFEFRVRTLSNSRIDDSKVSYIIEARHASGNDSGWLLVVNDAASVLESFRQSGNSILALAEKFVCSGRPFSTRIHRGQCRPPYYRPLPTPTLGWRPPHHIPKSHEYNYYEYIRDDFFRQPHARAALLKGGIVWRLAFESASCRAGEVALDGPSDEVLDCGTSIEPAGLWDDDLSEEEMDLICGVYKVFTRESVVTITFIF
jgi:hypothetical protein